MRTNAELLAALLWFAVGAFVVWAGLDLGIGATREPGSGFALFWVGLLMVGLAGFIAASALTVGGPSLGSLWQATRWGKVALVVVLLVAYAIAFERIGFLVGTAALLLVLLTVVDPVDWRIALPISAGAPIGVWAVLTRWLKIQLPAGILDGWIGH
jgi:putative tricarboxylic transport membrane protein